MSKAAEVTKLMSRLRINYQSRHRNLKQIDGPEGRINKLRKTVTGLVKNERIELHYARADEARGYAERLISDAIRYGECHRPTMEMADFWLQEKQLVHKLFKVLVPRYETFPLSYTRMWKAPREYPGHFRLNAVLELRGNPFPSLEQPTSKRRNLLHNVLLDEARKQNTMEKLEKIELNPKN
ncbi:large ribosomal subunit protein bL17m [Culicoides brevitarsis]|uniref:large ribosomal subunit protein bL17m n=1 Tax=Culicoides brevitarsis TaxID=469753 RepID=UPI00307B43A0